MKNSLFLGVFVLSLIMFYYGCDDAGIIEEKGTLEITGTVNGWSLGVKFLKALVYDSSTISVFMADSTSISAAGEFKLTLKTPPDNFPWTYKTSDTSCTHHAAISPTDLKNCRVSFSVYNDSNNYIGSLTRRNFNLAITAGSYIAEYVYYKTDYSISGSDTCYGTTVTNFNLIGTKGWNKTIVLFNVYNPPMSIQSSVSNTEPNGGWWAFGP